MSKLYAIVLVQDGMTKVSEYHDEAVFIDNEFCVMNGCNAFGTSAKDAFNYVTNDKASAVKTLKMLRSNFRKNKYFLYKLDEVKVD